ncbi:response regulator [Vibrio maerlii]|uniref:response regulator n=1 Tax=Vibrio maerlii TaxID=2231648 RepID=UPI000E3C3004|nr:response regulator [Vibrio maerlii]
MSSKEGKILIAEPCRSAAELLSHSLKEVGYFDLDLAFNTQDVSRLCKKYHYALLIIDYHLDKTLSGTKLLQSLEQAKLLAKDSSVLFTSSDSQMSTILSAISGHRASFLLTPYSKQVLQTKVQELLVVQRSFKEIYKHSCNFDFNSALREAWKTTHKVRENSRPIDYIVQYFRSNKDWAGLRTFCYRCEGIPNLVLFEIEASFRLNETALKEALERTKLYIQEHPIHIEAYDFMFELYLQQGEYDLALKAYDIAIELNPHVPQRPLDYLELMVTKRCGDYEKFMRLSKLFLNSLTTNDNDWMAMLAVHLRLSEIVFSRLGQRSNQEQFLKHLDRTLSLFSQQLNGMDSTNFKILRSLSLAKITMFNGQWVRAKKTLLDEVYPHIDKLTSLSNIVKLDLLVFAMTIGEFWLAQKTINSMGTISLDNRYITNSIKYINSIKSHYMTYAYLVRKMNHKTDNKAKLPFDVVYSTINAYPISSETNLLLLKYCINNTNQYCDLLFYQGSRIVKNISLTDSLSRERDITLSKLVRDKPELAKPCDQSQFILKDTMSRDILLHHNNAISTI